MAKQINNSKPATKETLVATNPGYLYEWSYRVFFVLLPCIYSGQIIDPVLIPRQLFLSFFLLILILFLLFQKGGSTSFSYLRSKVVIASCLFYLSYLFSIAFANTASEAIYTSSRIGVVCVFLILTLHLIHNRLITIKAIVEGVILSSFIAGFIGMYQVFEFYIQGKSVFDDLEMISSSLANKNLFSSFLFLTLPFIGAGLTFNKTWKVLSLLALIQILFFIWLLQTRAVWMGTTIAIITGCGALVAFRMFKGFSFKKNWKSIVLMTCLGIGLILYTFSIKDRLTYLLKTDSITSRIAIWNKTLLMIEDHPMGVGGGNWQVHFPSYGIDNLPEIDLGLTHYQRPHNDYLWILSEGGWIVLILYLSIFIFAFFNLIQKIRHSTERSERRVYLLLLSALAGYLVICFFDFPFERPEHQVLLMLCLAIAAGKPLPEGPSSSLNKNWYALVLIPVVFSIVICVNRISGEMHTQSLIKAHHSADWLSMKIAGKKALNKFYTMDPMSTPINWYIGVAEFSMNDIESAHENFLKAYEIHPNHIHVLNNLATTYEKQGNHDQSIKHYLRALEISPTFPDAKLNISGAYYNSGMYYKANEYLDLYNGQTDPKYLTFRKAILKAIDQDSIQKGIKKGPPSDLIP